MITFATEIIKIITAIKPKSRKGNNIMKTYIVSIYNIEKTTEKAIQITLPVSWNDKGNVKTMWFPKSVIVKQNDKSIEVKDWFVEKTERDNAFHGYEMHFDRI